eukprot:scaffold14625_cov125-Isochrysis_galbana.AAC.4
MGAPSRYPEIRQARTIYALKWLPRDFTDDRVLRQEWIDNNLTYLDARALAVFQARRDYSLRRESGFLLLLGLFTTICICAALACAPERGVRLEVAGVRLEVGLLRSMGGARADRAPSVLQPPIPSHKPLGSGRTLARSYFAGFFRTRAHLPTRHHHRLPQVSPIYLLGPWSGSHCDPTRIGFWEIGSSLGCAGGEESSLGSFERFHSDASNGARVAWGFLGVLVLRARKVEVGV